MVSATPKFDHFLLGNPILSDWIPQYLQEETRASLRVEMGKSRSPSDVEGYIYTFEIRGMLVCLGFAMICLILYYRTFPEQNDQAQSGTSSKSSQED
jgi:hypothetical protein